VPARARRPARPRLVTLSSDLGAAYAAQVKAVLAHELPMGQVVDLSHDLRPHDVGEAGFVVRAMAERFPAGSVHLVVVDPGVGGSRAPVAVACRDGSVLIGPDNGVLIPLATALGGGVGYRIDPRRLRVRFRVGTTFDGRDLFAPAAARVASGSRPERLGPRTTLYRPRERPARRTASGAEGVVVHVDRFGNLITDVRTEWVPSSATRIEVRLGRRKLSVPWVRSYEAGARGRPVALGSSFGSLEVAIPCGRAADRLGASVGTRVRFAWRESRRRTNGISERRR